MLKKLFVSVVALTALVSSAYAADVSRIQKIKDEGVLRACTPGDYRPFSMWNADKNQFEGFDIDMVTLLGTELGVKVEFVKSSWPTLMPDLQADKCDLAVGGITQNVNRMLVADFLPAYAPSGKVPLIRAKDKTKFTSLAAIDKPNVTVIVNPGGTNEKFVTANIKNAKVVVHPNNHEIPGLIAEGKGDVMFTDAYEAVVYAKLDKRIMPAAIAKPLTKITYMGFLIPAGDEGFTRMMNFLWNEADRRGDLKDLSKKWLE